MERRKNLMEEKKKKKKKKKKEERKRMRKENGKREEGAKIKVCPTLQHFLEKDGKRKEKNIHLPTSANKKD